MTAELPFLQGVFLVLFSLVCRNVTEAQPRVLNVMKHGAVADGRRDSSEAFSRAWNQACQFQSGTYMVHPMELRGPCKGPTEFQVKGVLKARTGKFFLDVDHWIAFRYIDHLTISGGGSFDGEGASAWPYNTLALIRFDFITNSWIHDITLINSKSFHFNIFSCKYLKIQHIRIRAPWNSPNTDGIHIGDSTNIEISHSRIATGDDCISMGSGSKTINITNVHCGPGHGISVGNLGRLPNEAAVIGVTVRNTILTGTSNGVRIKTWALSYPTTVSGVTFEHINVINVGNPIFIDQQYCLFQDCGQKGASQVKISHVKFIDIRGSSSKKTAVSLHCSPCMPCRDIELRDINIAYDGVRGPATSSCSYVSGAVNGKQVPPSCI